MSRRLKEFIEIKDYTSLDILISRITAVRDRLPADAEPEVRMKGDDVFGRVLSISYLRPQTKEETECDARYAEAYRQLHAVSRVPASDVVRLRSVV